MKIVKVLLLALVAMTGVIGYRYASWAQNWNGAPDPFDEVGIGLHAYMPGFVQDWGCAALKAEFGTRTLPPHGCQDASARAWR